MWSMKKKPSSTGFEVYLGDSGVRNVGGTYVRLSRGDIDGRLVWDLDIAFCANRNRIKRLLDRVN